MNKLKFILTSAIYQIIILNLYSIYLFFSEDNKNALFHISKDTLMTILFINTLLIWIIFFILRNQWIFTIFSKINKYTKKRLYKRELDILSINKNFEDLSKTELKKQFRIMAKRYHPDFAKNEKDRIEKNNKMALINEAYNFLLSKL